MKPVIIDNDHIENGHSFYIHLISLFILILVQGKQVMIFHL